MKWICKLKGKHTFRKRWEQDRGYEHNGMSYVVTIKLLECKHCGEQKISRRTTHLVCLAD